MAQKKKKYERNRTKNDDDEKEEERSSGMFRDLHTETIHGVIAVLFFVAALFLFLAALDRAGIAGRSLYGIISLLVGIGYFLLPILFLLVGVSLVQPTTRTFGPIKIVGALLFFLSGLGIIDLTMGKRGGMLGNTIAAPFVRLFDYQAGLLLLLALFVISLLILLNTRPLPPDFFPKSASFLSRIFAWFRRKKQDGDEGNDEDTLTYDGEDLTDPPPKPDALEVKKNTPEMETLEKEAAATATKMPVSETKHIPQEKDGLLLRSYEAGSIYTPPPASLLESDRGKPGVGDIKANANIIKRTLQNFGITVEMDEIAIGPSVTRYALKPAEGIKLSRIVGLKNDLALALAVHPLRIEAPIPGKSLVGIEIPNTHKTTVGLGGLVTADEFQKTSSPLLVTLGKGVSGKSHFANIEKMPHLLIAGATGSGKSVTIHSIITSLLYRNAPENLRFIMIDPKRVELTLYNNIPHLLTPVITNAKQTILALKWAAKEMDRRYDVLEAESVRDIGSYHSTIFGPALAKKQKNTADNNEERDAKFPERMPYIVVIIDELADIMQAYPRELESAIVRLAQMSRAVGIHLILSTQRPSVNIITGLIKANIPTRIALQVASQIDSRTILDTGGAETLLGAGDMLYLSGDMSKPQRIQSAFISEGEVKRVVDFLSRQYKEVLPDDITLSHEDTKNPLFNGPVLSQDEEGDDSLYEEAEEIVAHAGKASTSYLQRKLRIGYARAARLMDLLEERGVIGAADGSKPRAVITSDYSPHNEEMPADEIPSGI